MRVLLFLVLVVPSLAHIDFLSQTLGHYQPLFFNFARLKLLNILNPSINGTQCAEDLRTLMDAFFDAKWWALTMVDASGKFNGGVLEGNVKVLGNYDQCLALEKDQDGVGLDAQYCTIMVSPDHNLRDFIYQNIVGQRREHTGSLSLNLFQQHATLELGLCIPKSCTIPDLKNLWNRFQKLYQVPVRLKFSEKLCHSKNADINDIDIYIFWFFGIVVFVELWCTAYDVYTRHQKKKPNLFVNFSLYTNAKRLLSSHCENKTLTCLYGLRTISIVWIVVGHVTLFKILFSVNMLDVFSQWTQRLENGIFLAAVYAVDTFLAISGVLVVYVYLEYSRIYKLNFMLFYGHRFLRLGPALLATILLEMSVVKYFLKGPLEVPFSPANCETNFLHTLFFASNSVPREERCLVHSWYLAVDSQLYLLAPLIVYCFKRRPSATFLGLCVSCILSFVYTWMTVVNNNLGYSILIGNDSETIYFSTISRMPAWLIGTCLGYLLHMHNFRKIRISQKVNFVLWIFSISTMVTLSLYQVVIFREEHNVYRSAFFQTFSRPLWALSICFIIFSCCTGHASRLNSFLSNHVFIVIGKLSFCIYLVQVTIIQIIVGSKRQISYFSTSELLFDFWSYLVYILISAAVLCLVFETPTVSILRFIEAYASDYKRKKKL